MHVLGTEYLCERVLMIAPDRCVVDPVRVVATVGAVHVLRRVPEAGPPGCAVKRLLRRVRILRESEVTLQPAALKVLLRDRRICKLFLRGWRREEARQIGRDLSNVRAIIIPIYARRHIWHRTPLRLFGKVP